jgi:hypothetical protein
MRSTKPYGLRGSDTRFAPHNRSSLPASAARNFRPAGAVASTSIFLLAGLGLASGVCANDAIGQIEALARRMLRRSPDDHEKTTSDAKPVPDGRVPPPQPVTEIR